MYLLLFGILRAGKYGSTHRTYTYSDSPEQRDSIHGEQERWALKQELSTRYCTTTPSQQYTSTAAGVVGQSQQYLTVLYPTLVPKTGVRRGSLTTLSHLLEGIMLMRVRGRECSESQKASHTRLRLVGLTNSKRMGTQIAKTACYMKGRPVQGGSKAALSP